MRWVIGISEEKFKKIQQNYVASLGEVFDNLETLILDYEKDEKNEVLLGEFLGSLHSIKGTTGSFRLDFLATTCHIVEDFINAHEDLPFSKISDNCLKALDLMKSYRNDFSVNTELSNEGYEKKLKVIFSEKSVENQSKILIVEQSPTILKLYKNIFANQPFDISYADDAIDGLGRVIREKFNFLIASYKTSLFTGLELAKMVRSLDKIDKDFKIILVSGTENIVKISEIDFVVLKDITMGQKIREIFQLK